MHDLGRNLDTERFAHALNVAVDDHDVDVGYVGLGRLRELVTELEQAINPILDLGDVVHRIAHRELELILVLWTHKVNESTFFGANLELVVDGVIVKPVIVGIKVVN